MKVELDPSIEADITATADLPKACEARLHAEPAHKPPLRESAHIAHIERTRPHEGHFAREDIDQLRQLVDRSSTKNGADFRNARILEDLEDRAAVLIHVLERSLCGFSVFNHGAELVNAEGALAQSIALLAEQCRPFA